VRAAITRLDGPVHVLFNNAGVADTQPPPTVLSVNYLALRTLSAGLLDRMPDGGSIVNTASLANLCEGDAIRPVALHNAPTAFAKARTRDRLFRPAPDSQVGRLGITKEVVEVYTLRSSRPTMRRGVRTNTVCPGPIDTPLLPEFRASTSDKIIDWNIREMNGRAVHPREVASVLAFLGSAAASYVNGVNVDIDGGFKAALGTGQVDFYGRV
jgi:NAD(P)-dependent dehydrogenase (short-subunit alcohol dehydrogenase family)